MSKKNGTFIDLCLSGDVDYTEIDNFVERWHVGDDPRELHEYLGMTEREYAAWVASPEVLKDILASRKKGIPFRVAV